MTKFRVDTVRTDRDGRVLGTTSGFIWDIPTHLATESYIKRRWGPEDEDGYRRKDVGQETITAILTRKEDQ